MPGLVPGIHVLKADGTKDVDGRDKPGHDEIETPHGSQAILLVGFLLMNLHRLLNARLAAGKPVRVALIGAGKFGSMFLSQVPHTPGLEVSVIVDLDRDRAREACRTVGWDAGADRANSLHR